MAKNQFISILVFVTIFSSSGFCQNDYQSFVREVNVQEKSRLCAVLWNDYLRRDLDSIKLIGQELYKISKKEFYQYGEAIAMRCFGSYYIRSGFLEDGIGFLNKSLTVFLKNNDPILCSETFVELGNAYFMLGNFDQAEYHYLESIRYGTQLKNETSWFAAELGLGKTLVARGEIERGESYIKHYKNCSLALNKFEAAADAYGALANIELEKGNSEFAEFYLNKSVECAKKSRSKIHLAHAFTNKGIQLYLSKEFDSSLVCFKEALRLKMDVNSAKGIAESLFNLGDYFKEINLADSAIFYYTKSFDFSLSKGLTLDAYDAMNMLQKLGCHDNFSKAYDSLLLVQQRMDKGETNFISSINFSIKPVEERKKRRTDLWVGVAFSMIILVFFLGKRTN